jgi:uncharacterized glyoxalase superfamily protein PhnB
MLPGFSRVCHYRLQSPIYLEKEVTEMAVNYIPDGYHTVIPYVVVPDVEALIEFLEQVFEVKDKQVAEGPDGNIMHAEVRIGDSVVMMGNAANSEPFPGMLHVYVEDTDAHYERALNAGATSLRAPVDEFYGDRTGGVQDPFGNQWWFATHIEDVSPEEMQRRMQEQMQGAGQ